MSHQQNWLLVNKSYINYDNGNNKDNDSDNDVGGNNDDNNVKECSDLMIKMIMMITVITMMIRQWMLKLLDEYTWKVFRL